MTGIPILDVVLYLLGLCGMGGLIVALINRRLDQSDKRRDELEQARLDASILMAEGLCAVGGLAKATAIAVRDGKTNGETSHALETYELWRTRRASFLERQAAEHLRGEVGS